MAKRKTKEEEIAEHNVAVAEADKKAADEAKAAADAKAKADAEAAAKEEADKAKLADSPREKRWKAYLERYKIANPVKYERKSKNGEFDEIPETFK